MAQRTVALCNGKHIGIETIYTVINGQQINIPDKLKDLRAKSQNNDLFCPCGCGTNLILVAGDKNLREQHFREKVGTGKYECTMPIEGKTSIDSKIVLKCWLDDKLKATDIESRVPIDNIEDTKRKPEFSFLSLTAKLGIRYWRTRANIMEDRLEVLTGNMTGIKVIYIVDSSNGGIEGQYPEAMMKIQNKQQYCLLLDVRGLDYNQARMKAVFYEKNIDGLWTENTFVDAKLQDYSLSESNSLVCDENEIDSILWQAREKFTREQECEKEQRAEQEKARLERYILWKKQEEKRKEELKSQQEERERQIRVQKEEYEKRLKEAEERALEERKKREEDFKRDLESRFLQQQTQVRDSLGRRWIKCEYCGKIALENEFNSYGGANHINLGTCKSCSENNLIVKEHPIKVTPKREYDPLKCPECGGTLRMRNGAYGSFYGCSNYPKCLYSKPLKKK